MRTRILAISAITLIAAASIARSDPPPTSAPVRTSTAPASVETSDQVEALIKQLASDSWKDRQQAQEKLIALGALSKPRLDRLMHEATDPDTRTRAEAAVQQIEENRATGPSLITIHVKNAKPQSVIEELSRQCFAPLRVMPETLWTQRDWPPVTIDIQQQPFWIAMKEIAQKTGLHLQNNGGDQGMFLVEGGGVDISNAPTMVTGPFMVVAYNASQTNTIAFANRAAVNRMLNISFMVYAEPKLQVINHSYMAHITRAVDEKGQPLTPPNQYGASFSYDSSGVWPVNASLSLPKDPGKTIAKIEASTNLVLQTQSLIWEIPDPLNAKPLTKTIAGRAFSFKEARLANPSNNADDIYKIKVSIGRDRLNQRMQGYINLNALQVVDDSGKRLGNRGFNTTGDPSQMDYEITFDRNGNEGRTGPPAKLIWKLPLETKDKELTFQFSDLPLP